MSETAAERQYKSVSRAIPTTRRVLLNDESQLAGIKYSETPGGTLFSTTPGGTRIVYERKFLLECRASPLTRSPPPNLPKIPGVTSPIVEEEEPKQNGTIPEEPEAAAEAHKDEPQFDMDMDM